MIYIFLFLITTIAAISKATSEVLFSNPQVFLFKGAFWEVYDGYKIPFTKYKINALKVARVLTIASLLSPIWIFSGFITYILSGIVFIITFNIFYKKVLIKP